MNKRCLYCMAPPDELEELFQILRDYHVDQNIQIEAVKGGVFMWSYCPESLRVAFWGLKAIRKHWLSLLDSILKEQIEWDTISKTQPLGELEC